MPEATLAIVVIAVALAFDFTNGFHDTANAIATSVSTHALSPRAAVLLSAVMNFVGAFTTLKVAATIGSGIAPPSSFTLVMVFAALVGAIAWNLVTWYQGLPSSSSHALIGGLLGVAIVGIGVSGIEWGEVVGKMIIPLIISPIIGFVLAYAGMIVIYHVFLHVKPRTANRGFRWAQVFSAAFVAFSHGTNDAQKTMGLITLTLVTAHLQPSFPFHVPFWVIVAAASAMSLGTYAGGWRIIRTVGTRLYKIHPAEGFDAQMVSAIVIQSAAQFGLPVSTTHVVTGAIFGAGSTYQPGAVRWGVGLNIILAWIITIPMAALVSGIVYYLLHFLSR